MRLQTLVLVLAMAVSFVRGTLAEEFAWQQSDRYVPPDFEGFFPDNVEGGKHLDNLLTGKVKRGQKQGYPEVLRQGLRRATKFRSQILDGFGQEFTWRKVSDTEPQNVLAMEIMYQAVGSEYFRDDALCYGLQVAKNKTDNILRVLMEFGYDNRSRTIWGIKKYDEVEHVASRLLKLLDQHEQLAPKTVLTTYDVYQGITGKSPPQQERFQDLGRFVMVVEDNTALLDGSQSLESMRIPIDQALQLGDRLVDFSRRIHLGKVHLVALVQGVPTRDRLTDQLQDHARYRLVSTQLLRPISIVRLPEFQKHLPEGEILESPSWQEQVALAQQDYAWSRAESYTPPAFEDFFPEDVEGGIALDKLYAEREESLPSDQEVLTIVRQGMRHTTVRPNSLLGWFYPRFVRWPQNPVAMEIMYHSLGADTRPSGNDSILYGTLYYALNRTEKTENILRALSDVYLKADRSCKQRIMWLISSNQEKKVLANLMLETLDDYARLSSSQLVAAYDAYKQLTGKSPPKPERFAQVGRFVLIYGFEEETTEKEAVKIVRSLHEPGKNLLEVVSWPNKNKPDKLYVAALIQGIAERDRLLEIQRTQREKRLDMPFELFAAELLTKTWANHLVEAGLPGFQDYLD